MLATRISVVEQNGGSVTRRQDEGRRAEQGRDDSVVKYVRRSA